MGSTNPLEILENKCLDDKNVEDNEKARDSDVDPFMSDDESEKSDDSYDEKRKNKKVKKGGKQKTDEYGRMIRNKNKYTNQNIKSKLKLSKKYELYKKRKLEYEKDLKLIEESKSSVSEYQLSAIDRMTIRREQLLNKHSENFIKDVKRAKNI